MQEQTITTKTISPLRHIQNAVPIHETEATGRYPDVYELLEANHFSKFWQKDYTFFFQAENRVTLAVTVCSNHILRFRYAPKGIFERDFSYALSPTFKIDRTTITDLHESATAFSIHTTDIICEIQKSQLLVRIYNKKGVLLNKDNAPFRAIYTLLHGLAEVRISKMAYLEEAYFGLGDKSSTLNLRGATKQNWNTDAFAFDENRDPLYRSIPFYYGLHSGLGYGIFLDNTYRSHFDFAATEHQTTSFFAEGGEMNYYFVYGPDLLDVARHYTTISGRPELPPMWALGFHQCRWSYFPERRVREVAQEFRDRQIPCDAIYLDIDYMDAYRCFTWDNKHFPDPSAMIADLKAMGFNTVVMIDPGLLVDDAYEVYQSGLAMDAYCKRTSGELMIGPVWPSACVFPDFTRPDVRIWWGKLYEKLYSEQGVSGFWNDMNEPAVFKLDRLTFPDEVLHDYDGAPTNHRKAHNIYGLQMSKATYDGLKSLVPEKRPFLLSRATFSGGQRYAAIWTGDNVASWKHLHLANIQTQRLSVSGFSFAGSDIGGFAGVPTGELMVRWLQLGVFHPFFRVHSIGNNTDGASETEQETVLAQERINRLDQEPWAFGDENTFLAKAAIELRYQLLPYLYTAFRTYVQDGTPIVRSLVFFDQNDITTQSLQSEFMFGPNILVCPIELPSTIEGLILENNSSEETPTDDEDDSETEDAIEQEELVLAAYATHYLPKGLWYDFHTNHLLEGKQFVEIEVQLAKIPIYIQAGSVIPMYPIQQYVGEKAIEQVTLKVYFSKAQHESELYEDAGEGYAYQQGHYTFRTFMQQSSETHFELHQHIEGTMKQSYRFQVEIIGLPFTPSECQIDGISVGIEIADRLIVSCESAFQHIVLK